MTRKFDGDTLVVASHNKGKVREIAALLGPYVATFRSAAELDLPEPEETGDTFIANAELKARAAADSLRSDRAVRRQRSGGAGDRRAAGDLFGALGRRRQGFLRRHGAGEPGAGRRRPDAPISSAR